MAEIDPLKIQIAKQSANLFVTQMAAAGVTADVQLMAVELVAKTLMITQVKESKRLQFLDMWLKSIRNEVAGSLKKPKP